MLCDESVQHPIGLWLSVYVSYRRMFGLRQFVNVCRIGVLSA